MLKVEVWQGDDAFGRLRAEWEALAADSRQATPFHTPEWQATWWRHFGGRRTPRFFTVWEGGDLVGLMPALRAWGPWRTLLPSGTGPSDYLHPIFRKGSEAEAAPRLLERILDEPGVELIDLHQIPEDHPWARDTPGTRVLQATCLRIDLPHRFDDYLRGLSKSLRADVRRLDSADFRNGRLRIHRCGVEEADAGLRAFFELHAKRWRRRHLPGAFLGRLVPMHREWAPLAAERGWLRMYVLTLDRRPIGALYGMAMGGTTYFYQSGFDPEHGSRSPGTLLVGHAIREAIAEGHTTFDLMRGDEPYKRRWKPTQESRNFRFLVPGSGLRARLGQIWSLSSFRVEARVRERLETWS